MSAAATHEVITEYGIRQPDGTEVWSTTVAAQTPNGQTIYPTLSTVHTDRDSRAGFVKNLKAIAKEVGVDPLDYVSGHRLITRQRIVVVLPPVDADPTIQLGDTNGEVPF